MIRIQRNEDSVPLQTLSRSFNFAKKDEAKWWWSTAPMFANIMENSNYDVHAQYGFLCVHRDFVIPMLGPYPTKGDKMAWKSTLTRFGLPFELSFNYSKSLLRFAFEPLGPSTGTDEDPFNTKAIWKALESFQAILPGLDLRWFGHFVRELVVSDEDVQQIRDKELPVPMFKTQNQLAADLNPDGGMMLKAYIYPRIKAMVRGVTKENLMFEAIRKIDIDDWETLSAIWTLNGLRNDPETIIGLQWLKKLWELLPITHGRAPLPNCFHEPGDSPDEQLPLIVNFTLSPNNSMPEPQIYFPAYGKSDLEIAQGLATFFDHVGWSSLANSYASDLSSY
ncbi:unnamed protein product [Penicillium manginii]